MARRLRNARGAEKRPWSFEQVSKVIGLSPKQRIIMRRYFLKKLRRGVTTTDPS